MTEETKEIKKERKPFIFGFAVNKENQIEEIEFTSKAACKKWIEENAKGSTNKDGWLKLKDGGMIKFVQGRVLQYKQVSVGDLV